MVIAKPPMLRRTAALIALLCVGLLGQSFLHLSFKTLLLGAGSVVLIGLLQRLWFAERAYRFSEHERAEHILREREFATAQLRARGD